MICILQKKFITLVALFGEWNVFIILMEYYGSFSQTNPPDKYDISSNEIAGSILRIT